uniref:ADP,ATP carrier protein n=1 Tax=Pseudo-nitzschia australis TaxID=44445 RepID=A0A7S4ASC7_9STRA|mmetsp:Transcript_2631/g.5699  ORF Transcript_2631/g.5699 Transcript_2631/m.5699 type:complete len:379 (+) Transcript_2631:115-1251(+)|eukprot:CAMPEP_0168203242 /NCGR_PEP_ID=MMETSP0139_2-20121125/24740_1 /TAXON_ID=44445 /ORGANISM="Pseudo-nitzschia australis, Strain 10249 10 AB" /LENGTH=378 /DNA_ID=CAMNT_0008129061 /DNA_START=113 /DNA_END=1249 /DNA_ORIENTATION=+
MIYANTIFAFLFSALFFLQGTDGFSTLQQPLSLGRSNRRVGSISSFQRELSTITTTAGTVFHRHNANQKCDISKLRVKEEGEESEAAGAAEAMAKKVVGRKKRLTMGYQLASVTYAAAALISLISWGGVTSSSLYYVLGGGPVTAAVILYILKGAAIHDRLGSDTYKRLNLAVIAFALVQLAIPTDTLGLSLGLALKVPGFLSLVNGIKGYGYGCLGWDKSKEMTAVLVDFKEGVQSTLKGMTVIKAKSVGYIIGALIMGSMSLIKSKELATLLFFPSETDKPATALMIFTKLSKMARLGVVATIMYTLKDASDRDRLSGTTFVQLNFLAAAAFSSIAFYLLPTWGTGASSIGQVVLVSGIAVMSFLKGMANSVAKKE